ncbi:MAG: ABC transporter ATP-binding protein [Actinomycetota bacterium]|nr:ABC transporter ATP-binding protein [Actinomycetota bacterium]
MSEQNGKAMLAARDVVAGYVPEVDILNGVTLEVHEGEIVTLVGPNGAGKSTLIKTVFGLLQPRQGEVTFRDEQIGGLKPHEITRLGLSYVPQLDNVFPNLSVEDNLLMGGFVRSNLSFRAGELMDGVLGKKRAERRRALRERELRMGEARERIDYMYTLFPRLGERRKQDAGTMSGGERQMVAMAKALMPEPSVLLLDEPSAGLAPAFVDAIFEKIADVNSEGVTILMVEQNAKRALAMSDRGYVLDLGKERFEGPGRELIADPKVAELYLGGGSRIDDREDIAQVVGDEGL